MEILGPILDDPAGCEAVLRSVPQWFGIEAATLGYVQATTRLPTFVLREGGRTLAFVTLEQHFPAAWEVHCMAVHGERRSQGLGRRLHEHVECWAASQGGRWLQVKTLAASHPSLAYAQTRIFYEHMGYTPLEVFPTLWGPKMPVLQLIKPLLAASHPG